MEEEIRNAAYAYQLEIEAGERIVVGVNEFREEEAEPRMKQPAFPELEARQRERLSHIRSRRDDAAVRRSLDHLSELAQGDESLLPHMVEAVKVRATLGEISDIFREAWGVYRAAS